MSFSLPLSTLFLLFSFCRGCWLVHSIPNTIYSEEKKSLSHFPFPAILYIEKYFSSTFLVTTNIYGAKEKNMPSSKQTFITGNISMNVKSILQITLDHKKIYKVKYKTNITKWFRMRCCCCEEGLWWSGLRDTAQRNKTNIGEGRTTSLQLGNSTWEAEKALPTIDILNKIVIRNTFRFPFKV